MGTVTEAGETVALGAVHRGREESAAERTDTGAGETATVGAEIEGV